MDIVNAKLGSQKSWAFGRCLRMRNKWLGSRLECLYIVKTSRNLEKILKNSPKEGNLKLEMGRMWNYRP